MNRIPNSDLDLRVDPVEMLQYVHALMTDPSEARASTQASRVAARRWGDDSPIARAAQLRWDALNRAIPDQRLLVWTGRGAADQIHVPAAMIAAAGVARLTMSGDEVEFDIPALLEATLQLCEPGGNA
ncbi:MAG: hypothetical protein KGL34_08090 [Gammaproteobacteria bacterium]|nr:hypothetical protein [Gammaproteobacteria bacterium]